MESTSVQRLLCVNLLHFLSAGLIAPIFSFHVSSNGGNHVILGILLASIYLSKKNSKKILSKLTIRKKSELNLTFYMSFLTYLILSFCYKYYIICILRCLFELTNRVNFTTKEYIKIPNFNKIVDVTTVGGFSIGAIFGAYIYNNTDDFSIVAMVSTILTGLGIVILQYVQPDDLEVTKTDSKPNQQQVNFGFFCDNYHSILLKMTISAIFQVFFSKFPFLLISNHKIGVIIIGYTVAYQQMLKFASDYVLQLLMNQISLNKNLIFEISLIICGFSLSFLYFAPSYEFYLIVFVPMIFSYTLVIFFIDDCDILQLKKNEGNLNYTVGVFSDLVNVSMLVYFGIMCQMIGGGAFRVFAVLPIVTAVYLIKKRKEKRKEE